MLTRTWRAISACLILFSGLAFAVGTAPPSGALPGALSGRGHPEGSHVFGSPGGWTGDSLEGSPERQGLSAWVEPGETYDLFLARVDQSSGAVTASGMNTLDAVVTAPDGSTYPCNVPVGTSSCDVIRTASVSQGGEWTVNVRHTGPLNGPVSLINGGNPAEGIGHWELGVRNGSTWSPGRVWTDSLLSITRQSFPNGPANFRLYAVADGYQYTIDFDQFEGVQSKITASGVGLNNDCVPVRESRESPLTDVTNGGCGADYKLFVEPPAADLPASILPPVAAVGISDVTYTAEPTATSGTVNFNLDARRVTPAVVEALDASGTVLYTAPAVAANPGANSVDVDGGFTPTGPVTWRVSVEAEGELHLVLSDVEQLGGVTIRRQNGSIAPVSYDDTSLNNTSARVCESYPGPTNNGASFAADATTENPLLARQWARFPRDASCDSVDGNGWSEGEPPSSYGDGRNLDMWTGFASNAEGETVANPVADLAIVKSSPEDFRFVAGGEIPWLLTVTNNGPDAATDFSVSDTAPNGATIAAVESPQGTVTINDEATGFDIAGLNLASGDSFEVQVTGVAPTTDVPSTLINASAVVPGDQVDPDMSNNQAETGDPTDPNFECADDEPTCDVVTQESADVAVAKTVKGASQVRTGSKVSFELVVENLGPDAARNVVAADEPQPGMRFESMEIISSSESVEGVEVDGRILTADLLPVGAEVTLEATFTVTATEGTIKNVWFATSDTPDDDSTNNVDDGPADPSDPDDGDSDCTLAFAGCSSITIEQPDPQNPPDLTTNRTNNPAASPKVPSITGSPSSPASPASPGTPSTLSSLPRTGVGVSVLALTALALIGGGLLLRRRTAASGEGVTD